MKNLVYLFIVIFSLSLLVGCSGNGTNPVYADEYEFDSVELLGIERIDLSINVPTTTTHVYSVCVEGFLWVLAIKGNTVVMQQAFDDGVYSGQAAIACTP